MTNEEIDNYELAAMNATIATMSRAAGADMAGGDPVADLVRSCVDVLAGEDYQTVRSALHAATLAHGSPSPFIAPATLAAVADAVAVSIKYLAGIASDLVGGRYDFDGVGADMDSPHVGVDVFDALQRLADEIAERDAAADAVAGGPFDGVPTVASWDGAR